MTTLVNQIENLINTTFGAFTQRIVETYDDVEMEKLEELWEETFQSKLILSSSPKKVTATPTSIPSSPGGECPYMYQKGKRKGEICAAKARKNGTYCSRHKKHENSEPKKVGKTPLPKPRSKGKSLASSKRKSPRRSPQEKLVLRNNRKLGVLWHSLSGMVFKSKNERIVVGKVVNDKVVDLEEDDVETCKKYGFRYELPTTTEANDNDSDAEAEMVEPSSPDSLAAAFEEIDGDDEQEEDEEGSRQVVNPKYIAKALGLGQGQVEIQSDADSSSDED